MYSPLFKILQVFSNIYGCILIDRIFEEEKKQDIAYYTQFTRLYGHQEMG